MGSPAWAQPFSRTFSQNTYKYLLPRMSAHSAIMKCMHCFLLSCKFQSIHPRIRGSQKHTTKKDAFKTRGLGIYSPEYGLHKIQSTECHSSAPEIFKELHSVVSAQSANHNRMYIVLEKDCRKYRAQNVILVRQTYSKKCILSCLHIVRITT